MDLSDKKAYEYAKRLYLSRMRILCNHGFFGLLLLHMNYSIDSSTPTVYTDGIRIAFNPEFLDSLNDTELDFVMTHEVMHVVLQHCLRSEGFEQNRYSIAADIVANSNILLENNMDPKSITISKYGPLMHQAPNGNEGYLYTAEEVYAMLSLIPKNQSVAQGCGLDDHSHWKALDENDTLREVWTKRFVDACAAIDGGYGHLPAFAERLVKQLRAPQTDWRTILNDFIQEEIVDYSFFPPDRRFNDTPFFLPDFNAPADKVENVLFMIDTSASMSDNMVSTAYYEVKNALDQFDGKLRGWLGFFDAAIIEPKPFSDEETFSEISPIGGGGTNFQIIFEYVAKHMGNKPPASIIILTDGYAPFPKERLTLGIPVLWLLNNEEVNPPWGKVAHITV